jgi:hypothetical protein
MTCNYLQALRKTINSVWAQLVAVDDFTTWADVKDITLAELQEALHRLDAIEAEQKARLMPFLKPLGKRGIEMTDNLKTLRAHLEKTLARNIQLDLDGPRHLLLGEVFISRQVLKNALQQLDAIREPQGILADLKASGPSGAQ